METLKCIKCKKIIAKGETEEEIKSKIKENWIQCPYCGYMYQNPFKK